MSVLTSYPHSGADMVQPESWVPIGLGLEVLLPPDVKDGDCWDVVIQPYNTPYHLATAQIGETLAISSSYELLSLVANNLVCSFNNTSHTFNYLDKPSQPHLNHRSSNLVFFFNHLFLAIDRTLWWTDLDNLWNWYPTPSSEADFRTIEWEQSPISAVVRFNDLLFIHFPTTIYTVEYVGKPSIVRIQNRILGSGAITNRAVVCTKTTQFFLSASNFYSWSIDQGLQPIGQEVWKKFTAQVTDWFGIWCYHDLRNSEVCWVSGDTIWAYNYLEKHWQKYDSNYITDHATIPWYSDDTGSIVDSVRPNGVENVWVVEEGLCREHRVGEGLENALSFSMPYLETDEITYGDSHFHKKVDLVFVDCDYDFPWRGVDLRMSARNYVSERTVWKWVGRLDKFKHKSLQQIDFPAVQGRMLKFRFEIVSDFDIVGGTHNGGLRLDGKRLDLFNGLLHLGDVEQEFLGRQFKLWDGSFVFDNRVEAIGRFEFYSWGQRVDIPQTLIGPDK